MLDNLLGRKFSAKCKQSIKHIKARAFERTKKRQAMLNFLRKDIADLLTMGEEKNAFGRMDALIVETNHIACYDMIKRFCDHILSQLPTLQKQKECPEESMEAVATLIYAAARFSDLPELCDLRLVFTTRYGGALESSLNKEFVERISRKTFSRERKLKTMREIANEFSVNWDSKNFGQEKLMPTIPGQTKVDVKECKLKQGNSFDAPKVTQNTKAANTDNKQSDLSPAVNLMRQEVQPIANEVHVIPGSNRGFLADPAKKDLVYKHERKEPSNARSPPDLKPKNTEKAPLSDNYISQARQMVGSQSNDKRTINKPPPYVKLNEHRYGVHGDKVCEDDSMIAIEKQTVGTNKQRYGIHGKKSHEDDRTIAIEKQAVGTLKAEIKVNVIPPYIKDKGLRNALPVEEIQPAKPIEKQPVEHANRSTAPAINKIPPYFKPSAPKVERQAEHTANEDVGLPNEGMEEAKPKPRSVRRNNHGGLASSHQASEDVAVVNAEERIDQIIYGRRRGNRRGTHSFDANYNEEDMEIDRLLMHYSTKGMAAPQPEKPRKARKDRLMYHDVEITGAKAERERVIARVGSLPPERTTPRDANQNNMNARGAQVHPRLPDYDELAARFNALKRSQP